MTIISDLSSELDTAVYDMIFILSKCNKRLWEYDNYCYQVIFWKLYSALPLLDRLIYAFLEMY